MSMMAQAVIGSSQIVTVEVPQEDITPVEAPLVPLRLHLRESSSQRVHAILAKIRKAASILPHEHREVVSRSIDEWQASFFENYQIESPLDDQRREAAHALLFLRLSHIEHHIIGYAVGIKERINWVKLSNEIKGIVASILPLGTDVEAFINADTKKQLEVRLRYKIALVIKEVMPKIMAAFTELQDTLYHNVNRVNQNLQHEFEEIKSALANLNDERAVAIDDLHGEFDRLTNRITTIYQDLEKQLCQTREHGQRIKMKEREWMQLLDQCEAAIKRV